jgi:heme-degrading monooxygenase HmoA
MKAYTRKTFRAAVIAAFVAAIVTALAYAQDQSKASSTIDPSAGILTMVNVLTPAPGKQSETIQLLQSGMDETMRYQPGFISANIHRSLNSEHVVVYAQWKDLASVEAAGKLIQEGKAPNMATVFTIAQPAYHPYEVVSVHPAFKMK